MRTNREGYRVSDTHRECTKCGTIYETTNKMTLCKTCNSIRVKSKQPEWKMHQRAKQRAKSSGIEFTLEVSDIVIPTLCPILGIPIFCHTGRPGGEKNSPSLDRIDNSKGYTKDNIQIISHLANVMKASATTDELIKFADWVYQVTGKK